MIQAKAIQKAMSLFLILSHPYSAHSLIPSFIIGSSRQTQPQQHAKFFNGIVSEKNTHHLLSATTYSENEKPKSTPSLTNHNHNNLLAYLCSVTATLIFFSSATVANAAETNPFVFNGYYNDPLHPMCERRIKVSDDGTTFHFSGTATAPTGAAGCTPAERKQFGIRVGEFDGVVTGENKISLGDGVIEGVWDDGIRWNDGSKWTKKNAPAVEYDEDYGRELEGFYGI